MIENTKPDYVDQSQVRNETHKILSFCGCVQHPEVFKIDSSFIIELESFSESTLACLSACSYDVCLCIFMFNSHIEISRSFDNIWHNINKLESYIRF